MALRMELRQLRYFVAVAEERNISRAAKRIFLTQPALSRQIKALEEELGQCLLERQAHSISLTPAGETLLREARALLAQAETLVEKVRNSAQAVRLVVGYAPSLAAGLLSAAVGSFTQKHRDAQVELFDLSTAEMLAGLESGRLDVALTVGEDRERRGLHWTPLVRSPLQLAVPANHALATQAVVTPAEAARESLLAFCQRDYPEYWEGLIGWLKAHGQRPRIAAEYDGVDSLMAAVESGLGVAVVAVRPGRLVPEGVRLRPLDPAPEPLCVAAALRSERRADRVLAVFVAELQQAAKGSAPAPSAAGTRRKR